MSFHEDIDESNCTQVHLQMNSAEAFAKWKRSSTLIREPELKAKVIKFAKRRSVRFDYQTVYGQFLIVKMK